MKSSMGSIFVSDWETFKRTKPEGTEEEYKVLQEYILDCIKTPVVNTTKNQNQFNEFKENYRGDTKSDLELLDLFMRE